MDRDIIEKRQDIGFSPANGIHLMESDEFIGMTGNLNEFQSRERDSFDGKIINAIAKNLYRLFQSRERDSFDGKSKDCRNQ